MTMLNTFTRHILNVIQKLKHLLFISNNEHEQLKPTLMTHTNGHAHTKETIDSLLDEQQKLLLIRIRMMLPISQTKYETLISPTLHNLILYTYQLPASQYHHHAYVGGLLTHSLEVGLIALMHAEEFLLFSEHAPSFKKNEELKWRVLVLIAGLCHDLGKLLSDFNVILLLPEASQTKDIAMKQKAWDPYQSSFYDWLCSHPKQKYEIRWLPKRFKRHEKLSILGSFLILDKLLLSWVGEQGSHLLLDFIDGLSFQDKTQRISQIILTADQVSVEKQLSDAKQFWHAPNVDGKEMPLLSIIKLLIRTQLETQQWSINQKGARVWGEKNAVGLDVYLVWQQASQEIIDLLNEYHIPHTFDSGTLLDFLVKSGLFESHPDRGVTLSLAPSNLDQENKKHYLKMVKIKSSDWLGGCVDADLIDLSVVLYQLESAALNLPIISDTGDLSVKENEGLVSENHAQTEIKPQPIHQKKRGKAQRFLELLWFLKTECGHLVLDKGESFYIELGQLRAIYQQFGHEDKVLIDLLIDNKCCELTQEGGVLFHLPIDTITAP